MYDVKVFMDDYGFMPVRAHAEDAGLDLRSPVTVTIEPMGSVVIDTGVHLVIPKGYCGLLVSKSGLNVNLASTTTGLIDANYTGSLKVRIYNLSGDYLDIDKGRKFTQVVFLRCHHPNLVLEHVQEDGQRGDRGYGSSDIHEIGRVGLQ